MINVVVAIVCIAAESIAFVLFTERVIRAWLSHKRWWVAIALSMGLTTFRLPVECWCCSNTSASTF